MATQNIDFVGPTQAVGVDATPFTIQLVGGKGTVMLPFYNLPTRTHGNTITSPGVLQPFRNQQPQTYVQPMSMLLFHAYPMNIQGPNGISVNCATTAIDGQGLTAPGPFLGGGRTFSNFRVQVTASVHGASSATVTGWVVGHLHLASG